MDNAVTKHSKLLFNPRTTEDTLREIFKNIRTLGELKDVVREIINLAEFSDYLFVRLEREWHTKATQGLLSSLPPEIIREYHERRLYEHDLLLSYAKLNTQPIFSSEIYGYIDDAPFDIEITRKNRTLRQFHKRYNYCEHLLIPAYAHNESGNVLLMVTSIGIEKTCLQNAAMHFIPFFKLLCKGIDTVLSQKFHRVFISKHDRPKVLNQKPLAMLKATVTYDMPISDIADELNISPITAHQHMTTARKELGAKTNIGAVIRAIKAGLIRIE